MIYSGPLDPEFLLQMLGLVLFRSGGEQTFTSQEINDINNFVSRVKITAREDTITIKVTSKGGPNEDTQDKPSYVAPNDPGASKRHFSPQGGE